MLKTIVLFLFLLLIVSIGQENYASAVSLPSPHKGTSLYQQSQSPCKKTMDFLFTNRFADIPQIAITLDNHDHFKSKCALRLLAALNEYRKLELQSIHIDYHSFHSLHTDAIDYYIYALRRILI